MNEGNENKDNHKMRVNEGFMDFRQNIQVIAIGR